MVRECTIVVCSADMLQKCDRGSCLILHRSVNNDWARCLSMLSLSICNIVITEVVFLVIDDESLARADLRVLHEPPYDSHVDRAVPFASLLMLWGVVTWFIWRRFESAWRRSVDPTLAAVYAKMSDTEAGDATVHASSSTIELHLIAPSASNAGPTMGSKQSSDAPASASGYELEQKHGVDHAQPVHRKSAHEVELERQAAKSLATAVIEWHTDRIWCCSFVRVMCMTAVGAGCLLLAKSTDNWLAVAWWILFLLFDTKEYVT